MQPINNTSPNAPITIETLHMSISRSALLSLILQYAQKVIIATSSDKAEMISIIFIAFNKFIFGDDIEIPFNYKIVVIVSIIATMLVILIPDEKTMLSMLTLSFITPDNVVITENHIIDLITKIMDAVNNR